MPHICTGHCQTGVRFPWGIRSSGKAQTELSSRGHGNSNDLTAYVPRGYFAFGRSRLPRRRPSRHEKLAFDGGAIVRTTRTKRGDRPQSSNDKKAQCDGNEATAHAQLYRIRCLESTTPNRDKSECPIAAPPTAGEGAISTCCKSNGLRLLVSQSRNKRSAAKLW